MATTTTTTNKTTTTAAMASQRTTSRLYATILLLATSLRSISATEPAPRIVGGQDADFMEYPYFTSWGRSCGATLIHDDILLTAAHCNPVTTNQVVVGAYAKSVPMVNSEVRNIAMRMVHPDYNVETWNYDVMLLKLDEPVTNIPKVSINSDPAVPTVLSTVTPLGLGRMAEEDGNFPMFLQEVDVRVIDSETCNESPMYKGWIQESMICAGVSGGGQDACFGDSGGPLLQKDFTTGEITQIGVVSFGTGCARPDKPGVYHRVSSSYDWIQEQICTHSSIRPSSCDDKNNKNDKDKKVAVFPAEAEAQTVPAPIPAPVPVPTLAPIPAPTLAPIPAPTSVPEPATPPPLFTHPDNPPPLPLGMCEGDCDKDSDCGEGLFCFYKTNGIAQGIPGCDGVDNSSTDFCTLEKYRNAAGVNPTSPIRESIFTAKQSLRGSQETKRTGILPKPTGVDTSKKSSGILEGLFGRRFIP